MALRRGAGITALIFAALVVYLWIEGKPLLERLLVVHENHSKPQPAPIQDPIPADMMQHALSYPEAWAREQAVSRLRELYNDCGSWDAVRNVWALEFEN